MNDNRMRDEGGFFSAEAIKKADAILRDVGAGTFKVDKIGVITSEEDERAAWRRNPNISLLDARAIESFDTTVIDAVMAEAGAGANVSWGNETLESTRVRGVTSDYESFSGIRSTPRRLMRPFITGLPASSSRGKRRTSVPIAT